MKTALAEEIQRRGIRQSFLAERAGVSPSHLTRALKLERPLGADAIATIAGVLNIDINEIYDGQRLREPTENCAQPSPGQSPEAKDVKDDREHGESSESALSAKKRRSAA